MQKEALSLLWALWRRLDLQKGYVIPCPCELVFIYPVFDMCPNAGIGFFDQRIITSSPCCCGALSIIPYIILLKSLEKCLLETVFTPNSVNYIWAISCYRSLIIEMYCRVYYTESTGPARLNFAFLVHLNLRDVDSKLLRITANIITQLSVLLFAPSLSLSAIFSCSSLLSSK